MLKSESTEKEVVQKTLCCLSSHQEHFLNPHHLLLLFYFLIQTYWILTIHLSIFKHCILLSAF